MTTGTRRPGEFCWVNMITPQTAAARAFFSAVFGWTYFEMPGVGHRIDVGQHPIGGIFDLDGPSTPKGTPPHIGVMIKVVNADATSALVAARGGTAQPPFDIADRLRMGLCTDPNGARFDLWEPKSSLGTEAGTDRAGVPSWFETLTTDVERITEFYAAVFGWTAELVPSPGLDYTTFKLGNDSVAGAMQITPQMGEMPAHWATYFTVTSADETARLAAELGAKLCMSMKQVPGVGRFCGITSPQGVTFYVIQYMR